MRALAIAVLLLAPALARADGPAPGREASLDHTGSIGLLLAVGPEYAQVVDCLTCEHRTLTRDTSGVFDVGGSLALGAENRELLLRLRFVRLSSIVGEALFFGYRAYFGRDELKTFFEGELQGTWRPVATVGPRVGFGAMYELSPVLGAYATIAGSIGLGRAARFGVEANVGLQARTYVLE